jgi:raffinose/stachyose/melibiose transport system permease protein
MNALRMRPRLHGPTSVHALAQILRDRARARKRRQGGFLAAVALAGPAVVLMAVFVAWPTLSNLSISLTSWDGVGKPIGVGLRNYADAIGDPLFWGALFHTLEFAVLSTIAGLVVGYLLASAIYERVRGGSVFRVIFFIPVMIPLTMTAIIWQVLLDPTEGPVNRFLISIGVASPPQWLGDVGLALPVLIVATVWQFSGFLMIVFLAAMSRIPPEVQDAATIDGVRTWTRLRWITVPMTGRVIAVMGVISLIAGLKVFDVVFLMTNGGPGESTQVLGTYLYKAVFWSQEVGYGAAVAVLMTVIVGVAAVAYLRLIRPQPVEY